MLAQLAARGLQCRHQSDQDRRRYRDQRGEEEDSDIERGVECGRPESVAAHQHRRQ
jgi:hypothetical protein